MIHLDLFSGIGGFAYAVDQVWENAEHIFCDNDKFCQQVLKKHWPNSKIYGDIRDIRFDTNSDSDGRPAGDKEINPADTNKQTLGNIEKCDLLTGGFPCQPFSQAGKRKGTEDNRHLWPEMLRIIQLTKPQWVIAENVRGILTIEQGMVFEQVCLDLESSSYQVQPFIIPAVAVNAPHRRDRVWFVAKNTRYGNGQGSEDGRKLERQIPYKENAPESERPNSNAGEESIVNSTGERCNAGECVREGRQVLSTEIWKNKEDKQERGGRERRISEGSGNAPDTRSKRLERRKRTAFGSECCGGQDTGWEQNWLEVATELCGMDDGLSPELDFAGWTKAGHRVQRLKALGNSIVPQVAIEIMKSIKFSSADSFIKRNA